MVSIEVHIKRKHSENYEFGLCDFEAGSSENIEMHLSTCELFECDNPFCEFICKSLTDMKKHIREKDEQEKGYASHFKLDRNNSTERSIKIYVNQFLVRDRLYSLYSLLSGVPYLKNSQQNLS